MQMKNNRPSDTYKQLYYDIIEDVLHQICTKYMDYAIRPQIDGDEPHIAIWKKFEEQRKRALTNMEGDRIDRHKIASCYCGAILAARPLAARNGTKDFIAVNEICAILVGLGIIKDYMMYSIADKNELLSEFGHIKKYLKDNFSMKFPDVICDTRDYGDNLINALYRTHKKCVRINAECFCYDIWAYAKIFYHLELYNIPFMDDAYKLYCAS